MGGPLLLLTRSPIHSVFTSPSPPPVLPLVAAGGGASSAAISTPLDAFGRVLVALKANVVSGTYCNTEKELAHLASLQVHVSYLFTRNLLPVDQDIVFPQSLLTGEKKKKKKTMQYIDLRNATQCVVAKYYYARASRAPSRVKPKTTRGACLGVTEKVAGFVGFVWSFPQTPP